MDSEEPDLSDSAYMFQEAFNWNPQDQDVISRLHFTQEDFDLMAELPLDMNMMDSVLNGNDENPPSLPCAPTLWTSQLESIDEHASAALNTTSQIDPLGEWNQPTTQPLHVPSPDMPFVAQPHLANEMFPQPVFPEQAISVNSIGNIQAELPLHSTPTRTAPCKSSNDASPATLTAPKANKSIYDALKNDLVRIAERVKLNPRSVMSRNPPSGLLKRTSPFPKTRKVPSTPVKRPASTLISFTTSSLMKKRPRASTALNTPVKRQKVISPPNTDPGKSKSRAEGYSYPDSWDDASGEDILLFDLKDRNYSWREITDTFRRLTHREYARTTLQNRYNKIKSRIGEIPKSLLEEEALRDAAAAAAEAEAGNSAGTR